MPPCWTGRRPGAFRFSPKRRSGARTVHLNSRRDDARTLPLWHRPEDRAETVNAEFIENSFRVLLETSARLEAAESISRQAYWPGGRVPGAMPGRSPA